MNALEYYDKKRNGHANYSYYLEKQDTGYSFYNSYNTLQDKRDYEEIESLSATEVAGFKAELLENKAWKDFAPTRKWMEKFLSGDVDLFFERSGEVSRFESIGEEFCDGDGIVVNGYKIAPEAEYGGEGQGDEYWCVVKVSKDGEEISYWKYDGYYSSGGGGEYESVSKVSPKEKTVIVWG